MHEKVSRHFTAYRGNIMLLDILASYIDIFIG